MISARSSADNSPFTQVVEAISGLAGNLAPDQAGKPGRAHAAVGGVGDDDVVADQRPAAMRERGDAGDFAVPGAQVVRGADLDADHDPVETGVPEKKLKEIGYAITKEPANFELNSKIKRFLSQRRDMVDGKTPVDWKCVRYKIDR